MKRVIEVAWDQAMPVVEGLMEQVPALYPVRYRIRRFPDDAALSELERRGRPLDGQQAPRP
jgi:hypothetical protein